MGSNVKNDITYEYRVFTNRLVDVESMEVGKCTSKNLKNLKQKDKVDGRFFHTSDTDEWFFCWGGELQKLNLKGATLKDVKELIGETEVLIENVKIDKADKSDVADLSAKVDAIKLDDYATKTFVTNEIAKAQLEGGDVDLSGFVDRDELKDYAKTSDLDGYAKTSDIPSLDGYVTTDDLTGYAKTSDIPSLDGYVTTDDLTGYVTADDLTGYAKTSDIPSLDGYVTETKLDEKISDLLVINDSDSVSIGDGLKDALDKEYCTISYVKELVGEASYIAAEIMDDGNNTILNGE